MLSEDTIQSVRDRVNIAKVVGERVKLKRRGRSLVGLCPFHKEKSPSFNVNEDRNFYHCFGCHASGDAIKFVQETEGLSFIEAIRELAQQLGIEIQETHSPAERGEEDKARRRREELLAVSQAAAEYFVTALQRHPLSHLARAELKRRDLVAATADDAVGEALRAFHVGYAPKSWDGLSLTLRDAGLSLKAAETLGLVSPRRSGAGFFDRFRHRLMFAIVDLRGKVVAFSGRALEEPSPEQLRQAGLPADDRNEERVAKYINSPESPLYKKRELVFGLHQARSAVRNENRCVLVEGNFDVVSLHARGIQNVAAPLGTAFTPEQARQIKRFSHNVTLLFDGDGAGRRASTAARQACQAEALTARVAQLEDGMDPDDLIRTRGPEAVVRCIAAARGMLEYLIESALDDGFATADPQTQGDKLKEVVALLSSEDDPTVRALARAHADRIASKLQVQDARSFDALRRTVERAAAGPHHGDGDGLQPMVATPERARSPVRHDAIEEAVIGCLVEFPDLLQHEESQRLLRHVSGRLALWVATVAAAPQIQDAVEQLPQALRNIVAGRLAAPQLADVESALEVLLLNLRKLESRDRKKATLDLSRRLKEAAANGDVEAQTELLEDYGRSLKSRTAHT